MHWLKPALAALMALSLTGGTAALVMAQGEIISEPSNEGTELLPGLEFVTEEVAPGVHRVSSDGVRELAWPIEWNHFDAWVPPGVLIRANARDQTGIVANEDGVWLRRPEGVLRLGQAEPVWQAAPGESAHGLTVTTDGDLYRAQPRSVLRKGTWREVKVPRRFGVREVGSSLVGPDGTLWITGHNGLDGRERRWQLLRRDGDGWSRVPLPPETSAARPIPLAQASAAADGVLTVTPGRVVHRFTGGRWETLAGWDGQVSASLVGPDGSLWLESLEQIDSSRQFDRTDERVFLHAAGDGWSKHDAGHLIPGLANGVVAADGALWYAASDDPLANGGCGGVVRTDGTTTTRFLDDRCVHDLAVGPEGTVWAVASWWFGSYFSPESAGPIEVFAVTPDAWAAAGT